MGLINLFAVALGLLILGGLFVLVYRLQRPQRKTYAFALAHGLPEDPSQLGLGYSEKRFCFADGSSCPGWLIHGSCSTGPVMILSHGWNSCRYGSLVRVKLLEQFASQLVVYDLRGHGLSTASKSRLGTTEADELLEIIDQLEDQDTRIVLFGTSMGAGTAIAAASTAKDRQKKRIAAVIAEGPYRYFREPISGQLRCRKIPSFPLSELATALMAVRLGGLSRFDRAALAANLSCPLLVLHGTADPVCPIASARQIATSAPQGHIIEIEGAGHGNLADFDEPKYLEAIGLFMTSIRAGGDLLDLSAPSSCADRIESHK